MSKKKNKKSEKEVIDDVITDNESQEIVDEVQNTEEEAPELTKEEQLAYDLAESRDKHLRLLADFENYRNRVAKTQLASAETCAGKTIVKILPVLDDFERAEQQEEFSEGVSLVFQKLKNTLNQMGVEEIESTGLPLDVEVHEAITEIPAPTEELAGKVVDTIEKGYFLKGKVLRYAKVVVGKANK